MDRIRVKKNELLEILHKNRKEHRNTFLDAQKVYRKLVIEKLDAKLAQAREGGQIHLRELTMIVEPQDHTRDYDRAIGMLEMSVEHEVSLSEHEYRTYVEDNWEWTRNWALSNSAYTSSPKIREALHEQE